jgi:hypothetical protein
LLPGARRLRLSILLPISFWLARCHLPDIDSLLSSNVVFRALERRRLLLVSTTAKSGRGISIVRERYAKGEITREQFR